MGVSREVLEEVALTQAEYDLVVAKLGREPNMVELGMFGAMWSEHCGYKNSRPVLKLFPTKGPRVLQGPGENAGAIDIGDGRGGGDEDRVAQPPERCGALPGGGHGGGRHRSRHIHDGCEAHCHSGLPPIWPPIRAAQPIPHFRHRGRHSRLWQLHRRPHGGGRGVLRG